METREIIISDSPVKPASSSLATRELFEIGYRRRRSFGTVFLLVMLGALLAAIVMPRRYESETKILVHRERADTLVTPQQTAAVEQNMPNLTEEDINSEVAILRSQDLLEKVVTACDLQKMNINSRWDRLVAAVKDSEPMNEQTAIRKAAATLATDLRIEPVKKSYIISISYAAREPQFAARVLNTLGSLYLEKHAAVHRPNDAFGFFDRETQRYHQILDDADKRLAEFNFKEGVVTSQSEKDASVPKLAEFELSMHQTQAAIPSTEEHIRSLEGLLQKTPPRITTQLHKADNGGLMQQLNSSLVNLQTQRIDLLNKYSPGDRMVKEVENQIAQVRAAIEAQRTAPLSEETTDQNPTYAFLHQELAKSKAELASLKALASSSERVDESYHKLVVDRDQKQLEQQALIRDAKTAETNYLLYSGKREEARISNAFDKNRILNVSIAQAASVPIVPANPVFVILALGAVFGCFCSAGVVLVQERLDTSLRTPLQIEEYLDVPVLASVRNSGLETGGTVVR